LLDRLADRGKFLIGYDLRRKRHRKCHPLFHPEISEQWF
jgi:hypothetical protein